MNGKISSDSTILDECNHGTYVAGIIGAKGNNTKGIAGCNWNIKLSSLKIIDENGKGYSSDLILALNYATLNNISIFNLALPLQLVILMIFLFFLVRYIYQI